MVISEEVRTLLYPLGLISSVAFTLRFGIQWIQSEKAGASIVTAPFWWLSILGNIALGIHSLVQGQYSVCVVQSINGVIAVRNLNLMHAPKERWNLKTVLWMLLGAIILPTLLFWNSSFENWFRIPSHPFQSQIVAISPFWHLLGTFGVILFSSRFWVQWVLAERAHKSSLETPFWWLSLVGAAFSIVYFSIIQDYVNLIGPLFGVIPYIRNLILIQAKKS